MLGEKGTLTCKCGCLLIPTIVSLTKAIVVSWCCPKCGRSYSWTGYIRIDQIVEAPRELGDFVQEVTT